MKILTNTSIEECGEMRAQYAITLTWHAALERAYAERRLHRRHELQQYAAAEAALTALIAEEVHADLADALFGWMP